MPTGEPPSSGPYRSVASSVPCPRCGGRLHEIAIDDVPVFDCRACGGVYVPKATIDELSKPERHDLRIHFPRRDRVPEPADVRYLKCPVCAATMNRVNFAKITGVIVDVCKNDGIWFDAGEVNAVLDFVDAGGLDRAKDREQKEREIENERLRAAWVVEHEAAENAGLRRRNRLHLNDGERAMLEGLTGWFFRR